MRTGADLDHLGNESAGSERRTPRVGAWLAAAQYMRIILKPMVSFGPVLRRTQALPLD